MWPLTKTELLAKKKLHWQEGGVAAQEKIAPGMGIQFSQSCHGESLERLPSSASEIEDGEQKCRFVEYQNLKRLTFEPTAFAPRGAQPLSW